MQAGSGLIVVMLSLSCSLISAGQVVDISWAAEQRKTRQPIDVALRDDVLTVNAQGARLSDVLQAISEVVGFNLRLRGELNVPTTASFSLEVGEAIKQLVGRRSLMMQYAVPTESGTRRLIGVAVYQGTGDLESSVDVNRTSSRQAVGSVQDRTPTAKLIATPPEDGKITDGGEIVDSTVADTGEPTPEEAYVEEVCSDDARLDECALAYEDAYPSESMVGPNANFASSRK